MRLIIVFVAEKCFIYRIMSLNHLIDPVTDRIFFFTLQDAGYEARVVPAEHGLRLASQTEYKIINKAKQASWYRGYNVDAKTHTILVREIATDLTSNIQLIETLVPSFSVSECGPDTFVLVPKTHGYRTSTSYIYFHIDDTAGIRQWLASRPEGHWRMALGIDENPNAPSTELDITMRVMALFMGSGTEDEVRASTEWWMRKIERGEFEFRPCSRFHFPSGLVGYCNYLQWPEQDGSDPALLAREQQSADMLQQCVRQAMQDAARLGNDPEKIDAFLNERREKQQRQ